MAETSETSIKTCHYNDICVACLLFVETQSCSDLGGRGLIIPPYHRGSLPSVQHIGIVMFIPQELVGEELALEQDSLHRGVQNWDATPTFRQHLSKSWRKWLVRGERSSGGRGRWSGDSTVRGSLHVVPRVPAASEARRPRGGRSETSGAGTRDWSPVSEFTVTQRQYCVVGLKGKLVVFSHS